MVAIYVIIFGVAAISVSHRALKTLKKIESEAGKPTPHVKKFVNSFK